MEKHISIQVIVALEDTSFSYNFFVKDVFLLFRVLFSSLEFFFSLGFYSFGVLTRPNWRVFFSELKATSSKRPGVLAYSSVRYMVYFCG